ncbi:VanW family protein [Nocardia goodfellowii]|uniref:Vancomycin resistance protein YoaR n=1 Tax=Nocardia goodfellowii TaxID=882446 RepID=A0ABS4Q9U7_9NOCA|nr:VanW family protein [Nocardia goodfellowii]MBP2188463.1 vancomycin resistance protein YoaR [Nocardia goodfellowii]
MTNESSTGRHDRGEVTLRQLLEAKRAAAAAQSGGSQDAPTAQNAAMPQNAAMETVPMRTVARDDQRAFSGHQRIQDPPTEVMRPAEAQRRKPAPGPGPWWKSPAARRTGIAVGALLAVGVIGYATDLIRSSGEVPRGTVVAGVDIGGMETASADAKLRAALGGRAGQELPIRIGDVQTVLTPNAAGLDIDWDATWADIGDQPLNPVTRFASMFTTRTVPVASRVDETALDQQLTALRVHDRPTVEGTIVFEGAKPVAVPPVPGRELDAPAARTLLIDNWVLGAALDLPVHPAPVTVQPEALTKALTEVATPAVSGDVVFTGKDATGKETKATLDPAQIATILSFGPDGQGGLAAKFDQNIATGLLAPQLAPSEVEPKDATFALSGSSARVVPAVVGNKVNWQKTLEKLPALLLSPDQRTAEAIYEKVEPKLTTEAANSLKIVEPMGSFTTGGFSGPSGVNIRTVAAKVNGAVIKPGEVFSLNEFTGPRGVAEGYVESGIIDHGRPSTAVGGGISQFATTLYNAAYFAGLEDAGHTEHSYYISRYPAAREATVFDGAIDLKFRNNTANGVYIETVATGSDITVRLWGTKTVEVESITGEKTKPTEPNTVKLPKGKDCIASEGAPGFTISDTRVIKDRKTGKEISRHTRTVKYDPIPVVQCE